MAIRVSRIFRVAALIMIPLGCFGCVQQASSSAPPEDGGLASASTQLAAQATRIAALETANAALITAVARQEDFITYLATRGPPGAPTPRIALPTATGRIEAGLSVEGGSCCIGGVAGEVLTIGVEFTAESPFADVTEMRVATGLGALAQDAIDQAEWEPFVTTKQFSVIPPLNWTGFYVAVQYRDGLGNLSRVSQADISVEGMPAPPTSTPSP
jgi:hypothetical protein